MRTKDTTDLGNLFEQHGSDKSTYHDYHLLYAPLLTPHRSETLRLLEIGLATNNLAIVSNMGKGAGPGGSVRAFRDFLPHAQIFGADIDRQGPFSKTTGYARFMLINSERRITEGTRRQSQQRTLRSGDR